MEADSGASLNLIDELKFCMIQENLETPIQVDEKIETSLRIYAYAQKEPVQIVGTLWAEVKSITTGMKTKTKVTIVKGDTNPG